MPMYEFLCSDCNTIFTFYSKTVNTTKTPACPKCGHNSLSRMMSRFAVTGSSKNKIATDGDSEAGPGSDLPIDEAKMGKAMETLAAEAEHMNENDPRQAAQLMRRLTDMTGLKLGDKMEDALNRMEAGEDPEALEQELGDLDENDLFKIDQGKGNLSKSRRPAPRRDEALYEM
jgi:putative FmdB family regulatory protein